MKPYLLQHGRLLPALEAALDCEFGVVPLWKERDPAAFLVAQGHRFTGLVTSARVGASRSLMDALPALKVIASFGVGYDTLDMEAARERNIAVSNTPDVLNDCVADLAFALILDVLRGVSSADRLVRRGEWASGAVPRLARRVTGKKLGIVGLGRIGVEIARRAAGFRMPVRYHSRRPVQDAPWEHVPSLLALASWANILVVACTGGPSTHHLISADVLSALGADGFLVNIARGSVVDEAALVDALRQGRIAGAGLDVFENEPHVPAALLELDNVVLLPHIASATEETRAAMGALVVENLQCFFRSGQLLTPVP